MSATDCLSIFAKHYMTLWEMPGMPCLIRWGCGAGEWVPCVVCEFVAKSGVSP